MPTASLSHKNGETVIKKYSYLMVADFGVYGIGGTISKTWLEGGKGCLWKIRSKGSIQETPDLRLGD